MAKLNIYQGNFFKTEQSDMTFQNFYSFQYSKINCGKNSKDG